MHNMTEVKQDEVVLTLDPFKEEVKQEVVTEAKEKGIWTIIHYLRHWT